MRQHITEQEFYNTPQSVQLFIQIWQKRNSYTITPYLSYGQIIEMQMAVSGNLRHEINLVDEYASTGFFDNVHANPESLQAWAGKEPIEIAFYETCQSIRRLLSRHRKGLV